MTAAEYLAEAVKLLRLVAEEDRCSGYRYKTRDGFVSRPAQVFLFLLQLETLPPTDVRP